MSKLSLDALKERAEATASTELLASITGGNENACHDSAGDAVRKHTKYLQSQPRKVYTPLGELIMRKISEWLD